MTRLKMSETLTQLCLTDSHQAIVEMVSVSNFAGVCVEDAN